MNKYILDGHEAKPATDLLTWGAWFETADRTVAKSEVGESEISTVFIGLDHNFSGGPPLLFETMVFGGPLDGEQDRYSTWDEAVAGHEAIVKEVEEAQ